MKSDLARDDRIFLALLPSDWYGNYILAKSERHLSLDHFRSELLCNAEEVVETLWIEQRRVPLRPLEFVVTRDTPVFDDDGNFLLDDTGTYVGDNDSFGYKIECGNAPADHPWHERWPLALAEARAILEDKYRLAVKEEGLEAADLGWDDESVKWCAEHEAFRLMTSDSRTWEER